MKSFSTASPEGAYNGTLRDATSQAQMQLVILENGEFWAVYGQDDSSTFWVDGFTHGKAVSQAGSVRIDDLRDFGHLPPTSAPMNGRYDDSANALSGTITGPDGDIAIEAGRVTDGALYEYHAPADPVQLAGLWGMQSMRHGAGTLFDPCRRRAPCVIEPWLHGVRFGHTEIVGKECLRRADDLRPVVRGAGQAGIGRRGCLSDAG